ncbi:MAG: DNA polymerase III subunit beta [Syntrophomonadaceae bacterium]|jgi:DNA polymerase-3 subunit beta
MKININKKELTNLTNMVYRAASNKNTIPVLSGLLIKTDESEGLIITATDMEIGIKASTSNLEVLKEGTVLVNAHYFTDFIKLLPDRLITMEFNEEKAKLKIQYGRSTSYINTYPSGEYPDLLLDKIQQKFAIPQKTLKEGLRKTYFAASLTHFRQVFTGVLFDIKNDNILKIVASDTHRLACYSFILQECESEPFSFIIPTRTVNELLRILDDTDEIINIALCANNVVFLKNNFILQSRIIEGQYPNYDLVIPTNFVTTIKIKTSLLADTLERARTMPTGDKLKIQNVQLDISENEIEINSFSEIMGEIKEVIEKVKIEGDKNLKISFNTNYFLDIIKNLNMECEECEIKLSGMLGPSLITNPDKDNYLYVLVPLRTAK